MHRDIIRDVIKGEIKALEGVLKEINFAYNEAVEIIKDCKGKLIITGMGKSGNIGKKIAATFSSTGTPSFFLHPAEASHGDIGVIGGEDIVLAISLAGESEELTEILPSIKRLNIPLLALTGNPNSSLASYANVVLCMGIPKEACPLNLAPTSSTTVTLALGDALAVAVFKEKGFTEEQFAQRHPGGSLGRKLLLTVKDLMRSGKEIPQVNSHCAAKKVLIEITSKRLGMTFVTENEKIVGIITDGDLRRSLEKHGINFMKQSAEQMMTPEPKTITPETMAIDALRQMESHKITTLAICKENTLFGVIHLHDILQAKIA